MYLCLPCVSLVEYLHKPPSLCWTEELIVSLALGCFPWSAGRRAGSFMKCQGDRSTWPTLCCVRVSLRPPVLSADSSGDLLENRPQWTAVSSTVQLWCETGCAGLAYTGLGLGLWSVRAREWWEHRTMNQTRLMIWMFTVCGDLYNCVRSRSDWCSTKHKETISFGGQALSERTFVLV